MDAIKILLNEDGLKGPNEENIIKAITDEKNLKYKFIIGNDGVWKTIQDYSQDNICRWVPEEEGKYIIMVQGKKNESNKPFDFLAKEALTIANTNNQQKLIKDVLLEKGSVEIGEKFTIEVISELEPLLYRFWLKGAHGWEPLRDYTTESKYKYTATEEGRHEILIECKRVTSKENVDSFTTIRFEVKPKSKIEILDFQCLSTELLTNEELVFKAVASFGDKRNLLYKFIKISKEGRTSCIQEYSSRKIVAFREKEAGEYRLLCLVRDILSNREYDDRAIMYYQVEPYKKVEIKELWTDIKSPQLSGSTINIKVEAKGGRELVYRYLIEGTEALDSGFIRSKEYCWTPQKEGNYKITLQVKDISSEVEFEAIRTLDYNIDKKGSKPIRLVDVILTNKKNILVGNPINLKVIAEGGCSILYSFRVFRDNKEVESIEYGYANWANFIPEEKGEYEIEIRVKDKYSTKEYDSNTFIYIKALEYLPGEIEYVLLQPKDTYIVGDIIELEALVQNTENVLVRYITKINGHNVKDTGYIKNKKNQIKTKCSGKYLFQVFAKNIKSDQEYDTKKEVIVNVAESTPVTETKITLDKKEVKLNQEVTFNVESKGGKEVCYQFYIMEGGEWVRAQKYSRKNYYTFMPFLKGKYRVMVMAKSFYKKVNYEDYDEIIFEVT